MSPSDYMSAPDAADFVGVKRETLYAYVSRGLLESIPDPESTRARLYRRTDLERLKARAAARSGDGPVAASALRWGAPVLETAICEVRDSGPSYRGRSLESLVSSGVSFESVAELLWTGELPDQTQWEGVHVDRRRAWDSDEPLDVLRQAVLRRELADPTRFITGDGAALRHARELVDAMVASLCVAFDAPREPSIAASVAAALGGDAGEPAVVAAVNAALVVCAEHELNASAFAARVTASTGASLHASVSGALAAFSGPRHGGAGVGIRLLLEDVARHGAREAVLRKLSAGESLPGFGQPLYPGGDPRFALLWNAATRELPHSPGPVDELVEAADELGLEPPNLDLGLAAISTSCGFRSGVASGLFALGRTAGWIAHAREQMEQGFLLRPRARYVGE